MSLSRSQLSDSNSRCGVNYEARRLDEAVTRSECCCCRCNACSCSIFHSLREAKGRTFSFYNIMELLYYFQNILTGNTYRYSNILSYGLAGICATVLHDLVMNPAEVVKQRMQMLYSPYGGSLECARCIYRNEGIRAFYRSYATQLASNVPYQTIHFVTYEWFQQVFYTI